jgi:hypothetical protein
VWGGIRRYLEVFEGIVSFGGLRRLSQGFAGLRGMLGRAGHCEASLRRAAAALPESSPVGIEEC